MNKNRITAMLAVAAFAGIMHTHAAQENNAATPRDNNASEQKTAAPQAPAETAAATTPVTAAPVPVLVQPAEKFISEVKVYPTF